DERHAVRRGRQLLVEPGEAAGVELAATLAGPLAVQHDEPHRPKLDRVLNGRARRAGDVEVTAERVAVVVIAGQRVHRHAEPREQFANDRVLVVGGVVRQVAGDEHGIRHVRQLPHGLNNDGQAGDWIRVRPRRADVRVTELDEQERHGHRYGSRSYGYSVSRSYPSSVTSTRSSIMQPPNSFV